ncbi:unnamed protein product [Boreogadus saida]
MILRTKIHRYRETGPSTADEQKEELSDKHRVKTYGKRGKDQRGYRRQIPAPKSAQIQSNGEGKRCTETQEKFLSKLTPELAQQCQDAFCNVASRAEVSSGPRADILWPSSGRQELRELSGGPREMSGGHREMSGGHRELSGGHRELSGGHRELRELSGGHREQSGGRREMSGGHRELSGGHRELSGGHRELSGGHRELSGGHRELCRGCSLHLLLVHL